MITIISAYIIDLILGDPNWLPHPVKGIGKLISGFDKLLRGNKNPLLEKLKGIFFVIIIISIPTTITYFLLYLTNYIHYYFHLIVSTIIIYTLIAIKDMRDKANNVKQALLKNNIDLARKNLSMIVGRDTERLDEKRIIMATIESIAESICDGIIAPLFYIFIGGPITGIVYKCINTMDSMVGYKNEKYKNFGWFAAKLDDIANFIPARISGILIAISSLLLNYDSKSSFKILIRDGSKHPSPNSGLSEASMAGALQIQLGGPSTYNGIISNKPFIGDNIKKPKLSDIDKAINIMYVSSLIMIISGVFIKWLI